jgi:hypothetical protein
MNIVVGVIVFVFCVVALWILNEMRLTARGLTEIIEQLDELNSHASAALQVARKMRTTYPVTIEPGMYFPEESDIIGSQEMDVEMRERSLHNPYRNWEVFDDEEEAG